MRITFIFFFCWNALAAGPKDMSSVEYQKLESALVVLNSCLKLAPKTTADLGCVDSLRMLYDYCIPKRMTLFYHKHSRLEIFRVARYCKPVDDSFFHLPTFFEFDAKSCVNGYENVSTRLESFHRHTSITSLDEKFNHDFEKAGCKDYRRYVNFCAFVDGDLKNSPVERIETLPDLSRFYRNPTACPIEDTTSVGYGVAKIDQLLAENMKQQNESPYGKAVRILQQEPRRSMASEGSQNYCQQVRLGYEKLNCAKWESVSDEEPIYMKEDAFNKRRMQKKSGGDGQN